MLYKAKMMRSQHLTHITNCYLSPIANICKPDDGLRVERNMLFH